jgi:N-acetylneuraminic acid mutarotase
LPDGALSVPVQALDLQAEDGVDLRRALARGEVSLRAEADWTNALAEGRVKVGEINGLALDRWIPLGSDEAPSPRWGNTVVWTGREAVVWGGGATNFFYHDGARYDPVAFLWRAMSTNHSLAGRWFHAAVWTGREMLVWGGRAHGLPKTNAFQTGARYDPQTDTWKPISALGALSPRSQTAAVWTGRELIVWGGVADGYTPLADGARYNPETDTWKALPPCALEPRWEMSAVWTGTEMIVWGGVVQSAGKLRVFGDGARYNPDSDTWTALPSAGTFRARSAHTAVWTGTEMIIWGGVDSATTTYFNSGARYDPRLNRWTILPLFNAPEPRAYHVGVWTGAEMVVWGGRVTSRTDVNTGGRYDPVRDLWLSTTTHDAPRPRDFVRRDSAAWIDCGMFIFGGRDLEREFGTAHLWEPTHPVPLFRRAATRK